MLALLFLSLLTEQEPRHLQLLSDLEDSNIFTIIMGRKLHSTPTDYPFCIKVVPGQMQILPLPLKCRALFEH